MAIRIRYQYPDPLHLGYSIERLADARLFDFASGTFHDATAQPVASLTAETGLFAGRFRADFSPTPSASSQTATM